MTSSALNPTDTTPTGTPTDGIQYEHFLDCVHCGLCTSACPTYVITGNENDSPRGRIYLMRAMADQRIPVTNEAQRHLDLCLDCRACESACPSGVQYGRLIEPFRVQQESAALSPKRDDWFHRWILFGLFTRPQLMQAALKPARWAQRLRLDRMAEAFGLVGWLPPRLRQLVRMLPPLEAPTPPLPKFLPAKGTRRASVALFTGCVGDAVFGPTNWATARVLQENGCDVHVPEGQACCGAIHFHAGSSDPARELADTNIAALSESVDAIIVNVAGCGSMLKDYGHHWQDDRQEQRQQWAEKVQDVNQFLDQLGLVPPPGELPIKATYHDACHLAHAQQVRSAPRNLLRQIPGLTLIPLTESELCCGAAGTYNLTEPEMAQQLATRKLQHIKDTGADVVATANAGCLLQIAREARQQGQPLRVMHPIDLLDLSYRQQPWP